MAQTGSAQREPSMEEILASIRRIIQDSDTAQQPVDAGPEFDLPSDDIAAPVLREVEAFRAELDEPAPSQPAVVKPFASVAAESPAFAPAGNDSARSPERDAESVASVQEPRWSLSPDTAAPSADVAVQGASEKADVPEAQIDTSQDEETADQRPAIISDRTGRQVAAAFGELSEAFAASRRRSFDEMAQEMLRPMLQDWLDNNLPTLVERLVREEIERVARGG